ncbi:MAG TPA: transcriptional repressor [Anaerolineales bacterium]|nr:transcriptional repressor [Anaerolineales bacterium]HRF49240.1 transcriptional repressor [Anaerolineales bacterium]
MSLSESWLAQLQVEGGRVTAPRRAVVEILAETDRALNPAEVYELARRRHPAIGLVTVYRTIERLEALRLIERIHQHDGCHAFLRAAQGHEHVLLCERCGRALRFVGDDLEDLIRSLQERTGFIIREHWLQLFGLCPACQT